MYANKSNVRVSAARRMAPKENQDAIREYSRPEYEKWLAKFPHTQSLEPKAQVEAYRFWYQQIGAQKTK